MLRRCAHIAFVCTGLVLVALAGISPAGARSSSKHAAFIVDANTGAVLHQDDADELRHPASLTKMMTLYLTFETLEQGRMSMSSPVTISQEAASVAPSKLDLDPGEEITVREAILALITKSANDVAVALAEKIGGNEKNFVRLMNAKARELGMMKTNFENPSGLPDREQVTTARDMVTLGLRLQDDFPQYYPLFATRAFTYAGHSHRNHNTLMNNFSGIDGIKTGYTQASGFNLVSSVKRSGRHLVGAVFGGSSAASRNAEMRMLLTRALTKASPVKTRKPQPAYIAKLKSEPKRAERPAKPKPVEVSQVQTSPPPAPKPAKVAEPARALPQPVQRQAAQPAPKPQPDPSKAEAVPESAQADADVAPAQPTQQVAEAATPAPIAVTKVRRIMVAPRQGPKRPPPGPAETTDMEAAEPAAETAKADLQQPQRSALLASNDTAGLPEVSETIVAKTHKASMLGAADIAQKEIAAEAETQDAAAPAATVAPATAAAAPSAPTVKPAVAAAPAAAPAQPAKAIPASLKAPAAAKITTASTSGSLPDVRKAVAKPAAAPAAAVQRGLPPSSLEAQASALKTGRPERVASLSPVGGTGGGRFEIQIGAYNSVAEAQRALDAVHAKAGKVVANHASVTQPVDKGGRQIYRARFRGFDANSAASACGSLRQQSFDCFVMTAE